MALIPSVTLNSRMAVWVCHAVNVIKPLKVKAASIGSEVNELNRGERKEKRHVAEVHSRPCSNTSESKVFTLSGVTIFYFETKQSRLTKSASIKRGNKAIFLQTYVSKQNFWKLNVINKSMKVKLLTD